MPDASVPHNFLSASSYSETADIKKLKFIFNAIRRYATKNNKDFENLKVLEVACGVGGITLPLATLGCRVRAIDIDADDVKTLIAEANQKNYDNLNVSVADVFEFSENERYDVVVASEVFEHVLDPVRLAAVIKQHMVTGGHLILTTPNGFGPWELKNALSPIRIARKWNWIRRLTGNEPYVKGAGRDHCQRYTRRRLAEMFSSISMDLIDFAKSDFIFTLVRALRKNRFFGTLDVKIADVVPYWMASGWYMVFELNEK